MKNFFISWVLVVFMPLFGCSNDNFREATAITNVSVIHPETGLHKNQTVLFQNDQIVSVSSSVDNLPSVSEIIDGKDKFLIPGLWDMHVHLTYDDAFTESMPKLFLAHGITSVRDTGGLMEKMEPVIKKMRAPDAISPRVYFSGPLLDGKFVVYDGDLVPEIRTENSTI